MKNNLKISILRVSRIDLTKIPDMSLWKLVVEYFSLHEDDIINEYKISNKYSDNFLIKHRLLHFRAILDLGNVSTETRCLLTKIFHIVGQKVYLLNKERRKKI